MLKVYSADTILFKEKIYLTLLIELPNDKYVRIGDESLEDALMTKDHTDYVSSLARFYDEGIDCYIPDKILESGKTEDIEKAIREVAPELFSDEPEDEPEMTWDDIYKAADGCACGEPNLKRKDFARHEIVCWVEENFGFNLEDEAEENVIECVEECLDDYAERYNLIFDCEGHIIGCSEVTLQDKASELVSYYDDLPDRGDKDFDTLDIALDILREMTNSNPPETKLVTPKVVPEDAGEDEKIKPEFLEWDYQQIAKNYKLTGYVPKAEEMTQSWHADIPSAVSTVKISDLTENGQAFIESLRLPFGPRKPLEFITFNWSYEYGVSFFIRDVGGTEERGFIPNEEEAILMKDNRFKLPDIKYGYSSIEEIRADKELQNMGRYEYKKVLLEGKPVIVCTTNQQYEDILWDGINDTLRKFEEHFELRDEDILDIDDFSSEIRDIILDRYEKRGIRLIDIFEEY